MDMAAANETLKQWFASCGSAVVALSGGVDSCLVAFLARIIKLIFVEHPVDRFLSRDGSISV